jgi:hypothetical protein
MINEQRYKQELLILARGIKNLQQGKALAQTFTKIEDYELREKRLITCLLRTIFEQESERGENGTIGQSQG